MKRPSSDARRLFLRFMASIVALHTAAIGGFYALDISAAAERHQKLYAWGWMGLTVAVVLVGLQRLKRARRRNRSR